jgi:excisionase family DNA binding protein
LEKLLTAQQVAPLTQLDLQAIYRYAREKKIPSIRIGAKLRFPESALQRWIDDQLKGEKDKTAQARAAAA